MTLPASQLVQPSLQLCRGLREVQVCCSQDWESSCQRACCCCCEHLFWSAIRAWQAPWKLHSTWTFDDVQISSCVHNYRAFAAADCLSTSLRYLLPGRPEGAEVLPQKPLEEEVVCTRLLSTPRICFQLLGDPFARHVLLLSADRCSRPVPAREPCSGHHVWGDMERCHWLAYTGWVQA